MFIGISTIKDKDKDKSILSSWELLIEKFVLKII